MNKKSKNNLGCLVCKNSELTEIIDFGPMALAGGFLSASQIHKEEKFPMRLSFCEHCYTLQISDVIDKKKIFTTDYFYFSSAIGTLKKHFEKYAKDVSKKFLKTPSESSILEIGCNDGVLLKPFADLGIGTLIGVDPADNVISSIKNIDAHLINQFFDQNLVEGIIQKFGEMDVICANNVFAHLSELRSVTKAINKLLKNDGIFIFEVHYIDKLINETQYDMIYHEHLFYHSFLSLSEHFKIYNMQIIDIKKINIHGGSMRYYVSKIDNSNHNITCDALNLYELEKRNKFNSLETYTDFSKRVVNHKKMFSNLILKLKNKGFTIAGYGASGRANTLIQYCDLDNTIIDYIIDDAPKKSGYFTPGSHIPIINRNQLNKFKTPDYLIIFAWSFLDEILPRLKGIINNKAKIILPFPEIKVLELENNKIREQLN